jgi:hypothetical protein
MTAHFDTLPEVSQTSPDVPQIVRFPGLPTPEERHYLARGLDQPGEKLPLFDLDGRPVHPSLVRRCLARGWVEAWFANPLKPDWLVCKLTEKGRRAVTG